MEAFSHSFTFPLAAFSESAEEFLLSVDYCHPSLQCLLECYILFKTVQQKIADEEEESKWVFLTG